MVNSCPVNRDCLSVSPGWPGSPSGRRCPFAGKTSEGNGFPLSAGQSPDAVADHRVRPRAARVRPRAAAAGPRPPARPARAAPARRQRCSSAPPAPPGRPARWRRAPAITGWPGPRLPDRWSRNYLPRAPGRVRRPGYNALLAAGNSQPCRAGEGALRNTRSHRTALSRYPAKAVAAAVAYARLSRRTKTIPELITESKISSHRDTAFRGKRCYRN
jgi:hypothetical protein